jgi:predicted phosphodiesterase
MRIAVLADIHGNIVALDAVLADLAKCGPCDQVVVAGDLVWAGPRPREVVDRVISLGALVIQGNTDAFFKTTPDETPEGKEPSRFTAHLVWMHGQLGPKRVAYLAGLPFSHRISPAAAPGHDLLIVHANPCDLERAIMPGASVAELDALLLDAGREPPWQALAFGHMHTPFARTWRDRLLVNTSSVGLPMDGDQRAAYAILTWEADGKQDGSWRAEHRRVIYRAAIVAHDMRTNGLPRGKHFAERLMSATYRGPD